MKTTTARCPLHQPAEPDRPGVGRETRGKVSSQQWNTNNVAARRGPGSRPAPIPRPWSDGRVEGLTSLSDERIRAASLSGPRTEGGQEPVAAGDDRDQYVPAGAFAADDEAGWWSPRNTSTRFSSP